MKLHSIFGINGLARTCLCCGKIIGYTPIGDNVDEDLSNSKQIADATVCKECIDKLDNETCFVACDVNKEGYVISTYDTLWIKNNGLKEFFKELDLIQPINIMPKEHFYTVFGNVIKDFYSNKEDENNRT
ncbi:MAG: hypothetical protein [Bacteriophage sp.]|jgi:hypothetical protein|nr:MAG: hypothetical protein [Bacteriophage sp.]UVM91319.1 MAG: hypothetical protein [Bacteriophage sp.]UVX76395.1 MAG: hypothetical protein [Bacteriophage sp.]UWG28503.1 MAG: hypothetical protein [Bacteriophage sp.]UWH95005.1 MAG: hypothetical protein [Bacteriophage sp.]